MAFAKATLISRIRGIMNDNPWYDTCTEAMDTTEVDISVADTTKYDVGDIIEFQDDGEQCLVTALTSGTVLAVIRNHNYSVTATAGTGTTHATSGALAKTPAFTYKSIVEGVEQAIQTLYPYVYKKITATITPVSGESYYDAAATVLDISSAVQLNTSTPDKPVFYGHGTVSVIQNMPTAFSGSTTGSAYYFATFANTTNTVLVNGIGRVTDTIATGDYSDLTDGVQVECVAAYAVARLIAASDVSRTTQDDVTMADETVSPGTRTKLASYWEAKGLQYRHQWEMELAVTLPRMRKTGR